ncbi:hypothetical protein PR003_g22198 [Phytophthora rubi]|uniref:Uncharacterized protein n=1 Tax=Phytophthora rubi TaxID=129364 RepID=A0A6A3KMD4_9STRA|nr:hypothetical protein PR001_g21742 [Phytophthora rubi]KAE9004854.1 hypothetical protein PR002_g16940 [Phytophthora rubi]KAE9302657.1 hypothetical protein PR003_g22198 [Phytophthora rubi]
MLQALQNTHRQVYGTTDEALKRQYMSVYIDAGGGILKHIRQTSLILAE